jgi:ABC-2 type transport system ATP-binding protein
VATGTVEEVVRNAALTTLVLTGDNVAEAAIALRKAPGVDQVAPFGTTLHVVGRDAEALQRSVAEIAKLTNVNAAPAETSLEDVFIQLMGGARDNMQ